MRKNILVIAAMATITAALLLAGCSPKDAKGIFKSECVKCHSFKGIGSGIIDLDDVTEYRSDIWIKDQIIDARRHDTDSGMPRFGDALTEEEIDSVIQFLHSTP